MKILTIHSDFIEVEPKTKAIKSAEEIEKAKQRIEDCLVVFAAVEEGDKEKIAESTAREIIDVAKQVKANKIVLYPFVHLTNKPASPDSALSILKKIEPLLKEYEVYRAPFGWYKSFTIKCKGHPLAELSREISEEKETIVEKAKKIKSEFLILTQEGKEYELNLKNVEGCKILNKYPTLKSFVYSEEVKGQPSETPPSLKLMRKLEIADYEPASDIGHMRFYPKGTLIVELLKEWAYEIAVKRFKAMQIETPILYRWDDPAIREQGTLFREKDYRIKLPNKELVLRFAGDFGLFSMMKNATMSYKDLPVRMYEISPSFRLEQSGECVGLRRLRGFTMPDVHCFCENNIEKTKEEYEELFKHYTDLANATGIEYAVAFRVVKDFYDKNKKWFAELLKICKKPAMFEILEVEKHYWVVKHEYQGIDAVSGNTQLCTVQLDVHDGERYNICYTDKDNTKKPCIIIHSSIGSIERWIYSILENAAKMEKNPLLPMWLSPIQVRLCPINDSLLPHCEKIADELSKEQIRVDIDDRIESVQKKVRDAEVEWIPAIVVVGEREKKSGKLAVRFRETGKVKSMKSSDLIKLIKKETKDYPFKPLPLPSLLSKRPVFVG